MNEVTKNTIKNNQQVFHNIYERMYTKSMLGVTKIHSRITLLL